jgi:putative ATP-dependent endonuclease of OLD family
VLLVEGGEDVQLLRVWLSGLSSRVKNALSNGTLVLDDLAGAMNLRYKAGLYKSHVCGVFAFLDNDQEGRAAVQAALDAAVIVSNEYLQAVCQGMQESELEDFVVEECYKEAVQEEFAVGLVSKYMTNPRKKWSDRVRANFESAGKPWSATLEAQVKTLVACKASGLGLASLNPNRSEPIKALAKQLEARLAT